MKLQSVACVITDAARGRCAALARELARRGASVLLSDIKLDNVAKQTPALHQEIWKTDDIRVV